MAGGHLWTLTPWRRGRVLLLAVVVLVLSACSGEGDGVAGEPTPRPEDSEVAATRPPAETTPPETAPDGAGATIEPPLELTDASWAITHYRQSDGSITNTLEDDVLLVFGEDGTLSGHNGCNEFAGSWETTGPYFDYDEGEEAFEDKHDGQPITITAEVTTAVECEGFLADQDADIMASLVGAQIWYIGNIHGDEAGGITLSGDDARIYADSA